MTYKFKNRDYKITYEVLENSSLILIYKHGIFWMTAISYNMDEWKEDIRVAMRVIHKSCPRRWLKRVSEIDKNLPIWKG